ncbi:hypothetical protein [Chondromyces apiculatus]|uniref:FG-GAP repeat protein n=1 Tax=Chondromyces apiculatus DSM 436 TaxID=1192034 RepID=A0A017T0G4_9BACT|nr:hypothetical protein [Chondromyces apiculatus]EYF02350.1 Hypothetical protein CAP_7279 [Chondromyces apiculatus DSM 436]
MQALTFSRLVGLSCALVGGFSCVADGAPQQTTGITYRLPTLAEDLGEGATVPSTLRAAYIASVQARASEAYRPRHGGAAIHAHNPSQRFDAAITTQGVALAPADASAGWSWSVSTVAYGCDGALEAVQDSAPEIDEARVTYRRGDLEEWYVNGPLGLEQGFTLASAPVCRAAGGGLVTVALEAGGSLEPMLDADGTGLAWNDTDGQPVLRYTDLHVVDATGRVLASRMVLDDGRVSLQVDDTGATYPLVVDPLVATQQAKLLPALGGETNDYLGMSVAISGDTAVVGAHGVNETIHTSIWEPGAAYVFVRSGTTWTEQAKITTPDYDYSNQSGQFGRRVAINGDTLLVAASTRGYRPASTPYQQVGEVFVYLRSGTSWSLQQRLMASDWAAFARFGESLAIEGNTAVIGSFTDDVGSDSGSAYVFVRSGSTWTQQQKLVASDAAGGDNFGRSVAISGDRVLVGSEFDDVVTSTDNRGSAYVFVRSGSPAAWTQEAKLTGSDNGPNGRFGYSVSLSGDTAAVGAFLVVAPYAESGAAYVFSRNPSTSAWSQDQKLVPSSPSIYERFGSSVAISGNTLIVGAAAGDAPSTSDTGSAYVFRRAGSPATWTQNHEFFASDGAANDLFGDAVALDGDTALIGAWQDDDGGSSSGSAYVFTLADVP